MKQVAKFQGQFATEPRKSYYRPHPLPMHGVMVMLMMMGAESSSYYWDEKPPNNSCPISISLDWLWDILFSADEKFP